ncbi:MAG: hypothetical protein KF713_05945 [Turneriella sp.]|nr:hypothetical protein [Turneriella sp.]
MKIRKKIITVVALAFAANCATQKTFVTTSRESRDKVFDNLQSMIAQKNYNVLDANKGAGFIRAEKTTMNAALRVLSGMQNYDQLQVTVFQQAGETGVRVQAMSFQEKTNGFGVKNRDPMAPSEEVARDAREILQQFGGTVGELAEGG